MAEIVEIVPAGVDPIEALKRAHAAGVRDARIMLFDKDCRPCGVIRYTPEPAKGVHKRTGDGWLVAALAAWGIVVWGVCHLFELLLAGISQ